MIYRKLQGGPWHWSKKCHDWPGHSYEELMMKNGMRPLSGRLCDECFEKERMKKKRNKWKKRERA